MSEKPPQIEWLKDGMKLDSPDYKTTFDNGVATLTIDEVTHADCRLVSSACDLF